MNDNNKQDTAVAERTETRHTVRLTSPVSISLSAIRYDADGKVDLKALREDLEWTRETDRLEFLHLVTRMIREAPDRSFMTIQENMQLQEAISALEDLRLDSVKNGIEQNIPYSQLAFNYQKSETWFSKIKKAFGIRNAGQQYEDRKAAERRIMDKGMPVFPLRRK